MPNPELLAFELGRGAEPWPQDAKLFQPYGVEQILVPDNAYCLAVQAYLKMCGLPFEVEYRANAEFMSPSGTVPFIKCGENVVADFDSIISFVESKGISLTSHLDPAEKNDLIAYKSLINVVFKHSELYICWLDNETYNTVTKPRYGSVFPWPLNAIQTRNKRASVLNQLKAVNYYQKTIQEVYEDVESCCRALSDRLNDREFFFGSKPTELDALIYGHVRSIITMALPDGIKLYDIVGFYRNLINHMHRVGRTNYRCPRSILLQRQLSSESIVTGPVFDSQDSNKLFFANEDPSFERPLRTSTNSCYNRIRYLKSFTQSKESNNMCILICLIDDHLKLLMNSSEKIPRITAKDLDSYADLTEHDLNDALDIERNRIITNVRNKLNMNHHNDSVKRSMVLLNEILSRTSWSKDNSSQKTVSKEVDDNYETWRKDVDGLLHCIITLFRLGHIRFDKDNSEELQMNEKSENELHKYMNFATNIAEKASNKTINISTDTRFSNISFEITQKEDFDHENITENIEKVDLNEKLIFNLDITETNDKSTSISRLSIINHSTEPSELTANVSVPFSIFSVLRRLFSYSSTLITFRQSNASTPCPLQTQQLQMGTRKEIQIAHVEHIITPENIKIEETNRTYFKRLGTIYDGILDRNVQNHCTKHEAPQDDRTLHYDLNEEQTVEEFNITQRKYIDPEDVNKNDESFMTLSQHEVESVTTDNTSRSTNNFFIQTSSNFVFANNCSIQEECLNIALPKYKIVKSMELLSNVNKQDLVMCTEMESRDAFSFMSDNILRNFLATNLESLENIDNRNHINRWLSTSYISQRDGIDEAMVFVNMKIPFKKSSSFIKAPQRDDIIRAVSNISVANNQKMLHEKALLKSNDGTEEIENDYCGNFNSSLPLDGNNWEDDVFLCSYKNILKIDSMGKIAIKSSSNDFKESKEIIDDKMETNQNKLQQLETPEMIEKYDDNLTDPLFNDFNDSKLELEQPFGIPATYPNDLSTEHTLDIFENNYQLNEDLVSNTDNTETDIMSETVFKASFSDSKLEIKSQQSKSSEIMGKNLSSSNISSRTDILNSSVRKSETFTCSETTETMITDMLLKDSIDKIVEFDQNSTDIQRNTLECIIKYKNDLTTASPLGILGSSPGEDEDSICSSDITETEAMDERAMKFFSESKEKINEINQEEIEIQEFKSSEIIVQNNFLKIMSQTNVVGSKYERDNALSCSKSMIETNKTNEIVIEASFNDSKLESEENVNFRPEETKIPQFTQLNSVDVPCTDYLVSNDNVISRERNFLSSAFIPLFDDNDVEYNENTFKYPTRSNSSIPSVQSRKSNKTLTRESMNVMEFDNTLPSLENNLPISSFVFPDFNLDMIPQNHLVYHKSSQRGVSLVFDEENNVDLLFSNEFPRFDNVKGICSKRKFTDEVFANEKSLSINPKSDIPKKRCSCKKKKLLPKPSSDTYKEDQFKDPENETGVTNYFTENKPEMEPIVLEQIENVGVSTLLSPQYIKETLSTNGSVRTSTITSSSKLSDSTTPLDNLELKFEINDISDEDELLKYSLMPIKKNQLGVQVSQNGNHLSFACFGNKETKYDSQINDPQISQDEQIAIKTVCNDLISNFDVNDLKEELFDFLIVDNSKTDLLDSNKTYRYSQILKFPDSYVDIKFDEDDFNIVFKTESNRYSDSTIQKDVKFTLSNLTSFDLSDKNLMHLKFDKLATTLKSNLALADIKGIFSMTDLTSFCWNIEQLQTKYLRLVNQFVYYLTKVEKNPPKSNSRRTRCQSYENNRQQSENGFTSSEIDYHENERHSNLRFHNSPERISTHSSGNSELPLLHNLVHPNPTVRLDQLSILDSVLDDSSLESIVSDNQIFLYKNSNISSYESEVDVAKDTARVNNFLSFDEWRQLMNNAKRNASNDSSLVEKRVVSGNAELKNALINLDQKASNEDLLYQSDNLESLSFVFMDKIETSDKADNAGKIMFPNQSSLISMHSVSKLDESSSNSITNQSKVNEVKRNRSSSSALRKPNPSYLSHIDSPLLYSDHTLKSSELSQILLKEAIMENNEKEDNTNTKNKESVVLEVSINSPEKGEPKSFNLDNSKKAECKKCALRIDEITDGDLTKKITLEENSKRLSSANIKTGQSISKVSKNISGNMQNDLLENFQDLPKLTVQKDIPNNLVEPKKLNVSSNNSDVSIESSVPVAESSTCCVSLLKVNESNSSLYFLPDKKSVKIVSKLGIAKDEVKLNEYIKSIDVENINYDIPSEFDEILMDTSRVTLVEVNPNSSKQSITSGTNDSLPKLTKENSVFKATQNYTPDLNKISSSLSLLQNSVPSDDFSDISVESIPTFENFFSTPINGLSANQGSSDSIPRTHEALHYEEKRKKSMVVVKNISPDGSNEFTTQPIMQVNMSNIFKSETKEIKVGGPNKIVHKFKKLDRVNQLINQSIQVKDKKSTQTQDSISKHLISNSVLSNINRSIEAFPVLQDNNPSLDLSYRCKRESIINRDLQLNSMQMVNRFDDSCSCRPLPNIGPCICNVHRGFGSGTICYGTEGSIYPSSTHYDYNVTVHYDLRNLNIEKLESLKNDTKKSIIIDPSNFEQMMKFALDLFNKYNSYMRSVDSHLTSHTLKAIEPKKKMSDIVEVVDLNLITCEETEVIKPKRKISLRSLANKILDLKKRFVIHFESKAVKNYDNLKLATNYGNTSSNTQVERLKKDTKNLTSKKFYMIGNLSEKSNCINVEVIKLLCKSSTMVDKGLEEATTEPDIHLQDLELLNEPEEISLSLNATVKNSLIDIESIDNTFEENETDTQKQTQNHILDVDEINLFDATKAIQDEFISDFHIRPKLISESLSAITEEGSNLSESSSISESQYPIIPYPVKNFWSDIISNQSTSLVELVTSKSAESSSIYFIKVTSTESTEIKIFIEPDNPIWVHEESFNFERKLFEKQEINIEDTKKLENTQYFQMARSEMFGNLISIGNGLDRSQIDTNFLVRPKSPSGPAREIEQTEITTPFTIQHRENTKEVSTYPSKARSRSPSRDSYNSQNTDSSIQKTLTPSFDVNSDNIINEKKVLKNASPTLLRYLNMENLKNTEQIYDTELYSISNTILGLSIPEKDYKVNEKIDVKNVDVKDHEKFQNIPPYKIKQQENQSQTVLIISKNKMMNSESETGLKENSLSNTNFLNKRNQSKQDANKEKSKGTSAKPSLDSTSDSSSVWNSLSNTHKIDSCAFLTEFQNRLKSSAMTISRSDLESDLTDYIPFETNLNSASQTKTLSSCCSSRSSSVKKIPKHLNVRQMVNESPFSSNIYSTYPSSSEEVQLSKILSPTFKTTTEIQKNCGSTFGTDECDVQIENMSNQLDDLINSLFKPRFKEPFSFLTKKENKKEQKKNGKNIN